MRKKLLAGIMGVVMAASLAGCGTSTDTTATTEDTTAQASTEEAAAAQSTVADTATDTTNTNLTGTVTMAGSTSMEKLANSVAEAFMAKYPGVSVTAEFTGSSAGIESLVVGSVDIGNSSRDLKDDETAEGCVQNVVAIDGIAVVTDTANTAVDVTKDQLIGIYTGEITNWNEVGGPDEAIVVIGREAGSGTRGAFEELLDIADKCAYANELDSTGAVMAKVAATPGSIGYVSLDVVDDTVKALTLDGVEATEANIKAGSYLLSRPFVMATMGDISSQSEAVQEFFKYLSSDEGKAVIKGAGLITVD